MGERAKSESNAGAPAWMATFADMMSLLLTFFVLLLSFAEMDIVKFKDALGSINIALGADPPHPMSIHMTPSTSGHIQSPIQTTIASVTDEALLKDIQRLIEELGLQKDAEAEDSARGVILRIRGRTFFDAGTAEVKSTSHPVLSRISGLVNKFERKIAIEGHTDNIPINGSRYSSNWELSTARAYSVLKLLQYQGSLDISSINLGGFGDTRPVTSNDSPEGRSRNRRVEFVFYEQ